MEEMTRQEERRAPTTFLYATESRFRSSFVNSFPVSVTCHRPSPVSSRQREDKGVIEGGSDKRSFKIDSGCKERGGERSVTDGQWP